MKQVMVMIAMLGCGCSKQVVPATAPVVAPAQVCPRHLVPAADVDAEACLESAVSQLEMNECVRAEAARADAALQDAYRGLLARGDAEARGLLRASQQAFERYREAHCELVADINRGGSLAPLGRAACQADLARIQLSDLGGYGADAGGIR